MNTDQRTQQMIHDIAAELERVRSLFPGNVHQLTAFNEEAGELNKAMLQNHHDGIGDRDVYEEAVQAAVTAIRVATEGDSTFVYSPEAGIDRYQECITLDANGVDVNG